MSNQNKNRAQEIQRAGSPLVGVSGEDSSQLQTRRFYRYPELHKLMGQLSWDSGKYANDIIAEIRSNNAKMRSPKIFPNKIETKRRTRLLPSTKAILQRWFEDHLSYPYPTAAEKQQLIEQCGGDVNSSMVANWFFNTRKRVNWRPPRSEQKQGSCITKKTHSHNSTESKSST